MLNLSVDRTSDVPLYRQLANQLRDLIVQGILPPGDRLPPVRQVAETFGLTRLTVHAAYSELQASGLVESYVGRGTFVTERPRRLGPREDAGSVPAASASVPWVSRGLLVELAQNGQDAGPDESLISLAQAYPAPETYPARDFERALHAALREQTSLSYGPLAGEPALREQVARLLLERGVSISPGHLLITAGAQQALALVLHALTTPDEVILVEEPTYPGMIELAAQRGQRVVGVPTDHEGVVLDALAAACARYRPRLFYITPTYHNPTGVSLAADRREGVLRLAEQYDLVVVEDDTYGFMGFEGEPPPALKAADMSGRVVHISNFSKAFLPALRIGALAADPRYLPRLAAAKQATDLVTSSLLQRALAAYLRQGLFHAHLEHCRAIYQARATALLHSLERAAPVGCTWSRPMGGLSVWITLSEAVDEREVSRSARERGVSVAGGQLFYLQPQPQSHLRVCFGMEPPARIQQGIALLGEVMAQQQRRYEQRLGRAGGGVHPVV